jgi:outer membrane immunogenic protein
MRILAGALTALALSAPISALAADLPVKAPPMVPIVDLWSGWYIGVNGGYSWGRWDSTSLAGIFPGPAGLATTYAPRVDGWLFGAQVGYNWRIDHNWVLGFEGDFQWTGEKRSVTGGAITPQIPEVGGDFNDIFTTTASASWKFPWFATLRGRLGVLVDPTLLLYGTGGLAIGNFKYEFAGAVTCQRFGPGSTGTTPQSTPCGTRPGPGAPPVGAVALSESETRLGLAVGAGLEKKFNRNWSAKAEYLYLDFGTRTFLGGTGFDTSARLRDHVFRLGINYAFDAGPVVARY